MNLKIILRDLYVFYILFILLFTKYVERIAPMDLKESWQKHPALLSAVIVLWFVFFVYAFIMLKYRSNKKEDPNFLKKQIEKGIWHHLVFQGTIAFFILSAYLIASAYIKNPTIDFPYHALLVGFIVYPIVYIWWIIMKKRHEKLIKSNNE